jgi:Rieske Fe-S protein
MIAGALNVAGGVFGSREYPTAVLEPGQGVVLRLGRDSVAVYRDTSGAVHAVSAVCPHQHSIVAFDPDGPGWLCPRHGARFGVAGAVVDDVGPVDEALPVRASACQPISGRWPSPGQGFESTAGPG